MNFYLLCISQIGLHHLSYPFKVILSNDKEFEILKHLKYMVIGTILVKNCVGAINVSLTFTPN